MTSPDGPLPTPQRVKEIGGLEDAHDISNESVPEVLWATRGRLSIKQTSEEEALREEGERLSYCEVSQAEWNRIRERTEGKSIVVWAKGEKIFAWLAHQMLEKSE